MLWQDYPKPCNIGQQTFWCGKAGGLIQFLKSSKCKISYSNRYGIIRFKLYTTLRRQSHNPFRSWRTVYDSVNRSSWKMSEKWKLWLFRYTPVDSNVLPTNSTYYTSSALMAWEQFQSSGCKSIPSCDHSCESSNLPRHKLPLQHGKFGSWFKKNHRQMIPNTTFYKKPASRYYYKPEEPVIRQAHF